ncbi:hypothetical protein GGI35DRAFT_370769 [Trichoderma velutinum]
MDGHACTLAQPCPHHPHCHAVKRKLQSDATVPPPGPPPRVPLPSLSCPTRPSYPISQPHPHYAVGINHQFPRAQNTGFRVRQSKEIPTPPAYPPPKHQTFLPPAPSFNITAGPSTTGISASTRTVALARSSINAPNRSLSISTGDRESNTTKPINKNIQESTFRSTTDHRPKNALFNGFFHLDRLSSEQLRTMFLKELTDRRGSEEMKQRRRLEYFINPRPLTFLKVVMVFCSLCALTIEEPRKAGPWKSDRLRQALNLSGKRKKKSVEIEWNYKRYQLNVKSGITLSLLLDYDQSTREEYVEWLKRLDNACKTGIRIDEAIRVVGFHKADRAHTAKKNSQAKYKEALKGQVALAN